MSEERTEQPTARKLQKAREKGQIVRSREVHDVMQLAASLTALVWCGGYMVDGLSRHITGGLEAMGNSGRRAVGIGEINGLAIEMGASLAMLVGPVALAAVLGGLAAFAAQGGFTVTWEPLTPNLGRLSPLAGLKKLAPSRAGIDLVRTLFAFAGLAWISWDIVRDLLARAQTLGRLTPAAAGILTWQSADLLLRRTLIVLGTLAAADFLVQRWRFMRGQRMTKQEVKDEMRMMEGSPEIKGRIRRAQREMARRRMLAAVPQATVVITNPTHIAVALEYRRERMQAPKVVAMGGDLMADRIRKVARESGVPIVENVTLARALFKHAEVGDSIPGDLFEAVAEVLAYLVRLKQLAL